MKFSDKLSMIVKLWSFLECENVSSKPKLSKYWSYISTWCVSDPLMQWVFYSHQNEWKEIIIMVAFNELFLHQLSVFLLIDGEQPWINNWSFNKFDFLFIIKSYIPTDNRRLSFVWHYYLRQKSFISIHRKWYLILPIMTGSR